MGVRRTNLGKRVCLKAVVCGAVGSGKTASEVALRAEFVLCPAADALDRKTPLQTSKFGVTVYNLFCSLSWLVVKTGEKSSKQISETVLNPYVGHQRVPNLCSFISFGVIDEKA